MSPVFCSLRLEMSDLFQMTNNTFAFYKEMSLSISKPPNHCPEITKWNYLCKSVSASSAFIFCIKNEKKGDKNREK